MFVSALMVALALSCVAATGDDGKLKRYGQHLAQECTACHRLDGVDKGIPSIAGWEPDLFVRTLKFYQDGTRSNPVMVSVARSLDQEQLAALAAYYGSLQKPAPRK